jgi:hypothetical protein
MVSDDISTDTARILYLTYGSDAIEMAELRCNELAASGDKQGVKNWRSILRVVRQLVSAAPSDSGSVN